MTSAFERRELEFFTRKRQREKIVFFTPALWQMGFQEGDTKLERFMPKINIPKGNY